MNDTIKTSLITAGILILGAGGGIVGYNLTGQEVVTSNPLLQHSIHSTDKTCEKGKVRLSVNNVAYKDDVPISISIRANVYAEEDTYEVINVAEVDKCTACIENNFDYTNYNKCMGLPMAKNGACYYNNLNLEAYQSCYEDESYTVTSWVGNEPVDEAVPCVPVDAQLTAECASFDYGVFDHRYETVTNQAEIDACYETAEDISTCPEPITEVTFQNDFTDYFGGLDYNNDEVMKAQIQKFLTEKKNFNF